MRASHIAAAFGARRRLRWASATNRWHALYFTSAGTQLKVISRKKVVIGSCDFSDLRFSTQGRRHAAIENSVNIQAEIDFENPFTIEAMYLERGGTSAQLTWGGATSRIIAPGSIDVQTDAVLPAAFGLSAFTRGDVLWLRTVTSVSAAGMISPQTVPYADTGEGAYTYDPATATVSAIGGTGALTASGSGYTAQTGLYAPLVVGTPIVGTGPDTYVTGIGDSIVAYVGDGPANAGPYYGFFQRSLVGADLTTDPIAGCNMGVGNGNAAIWNSATCGKALLKYGNVAVEEYGTNGVYEAASRAIWAAARSAGSRVIRTKMITKAGSSNGWVDTAGQSKFSGWEVGGGAYNWNESLSEMSGYDTFVDLMQATGSASDRYLWDTNGTAQWPTTDGVHPGPPKHAAIGAMLRLAY